MVRHSLAEIVFDPYLQQLRVVNSENSSYHGYLKCQKHASIFFNVQSPRDFLQLQETSSKRTCKFFPDCRSLPFCFTIKMLYGATFSF